MRATIITKFDHDNLIPGSIRWDDDYSQMDFVCPCGCGKIGSINLQPHHSDGWLMRGTRDAPIISPSIYFEKERPGEWHGYLGGSDGLRPGEWVKC